MKFNDTIWIMDVEITPSFMRMTDWIEVIGQIQRPILIYRSTLNPTVTNAASLMGTSAWETPIAVFGNSLTITVREKPCFQFS